MPMYDYLCTAKKCKHEFEENVPYDKSNEVKCPKCGTLSEKVFVKAFKPHVSWSQWKVSLNQG